MDVSQIKTKVNVPNNSMGDSNKSFELTGLDTVENFSVLNSNINSSGTSVSNHGFSQGNDSGALDFLYGNLSDINLVTQDPKVGMNVGELLKKDDRIDNAMIEKLDFEEGSNVFDLINNTSFAESSSSLGLITDSSRDKMSMDKLLDSDIPIIDDFSSNNFEQSSNSLETDVDMDNFLGLK